MSAVEASGQACSADRMAQKWEKEGAEPFTHGKGQERGEDPE